MTSKRELHIHPRFPNGIKALAPVATTSEAKLEALSITADSVVATVEMMPTGENRAVQIHWGDDNVDFVDFRRPPMRVDPNLPPGSVKVQHVYRMSAVTGHYPNRVIVLLAIYSDDGRRTFEGTALDIEPRFRCTIYPTVVKATHHDTFDEISEFDITMQVRQGDNELVNKQWRWEPKTFDINFGSTTVGIVAERMLDGSGTTTEITLGGPEINVYTRYVDDDGVWGLIKRLGEVLTDIPVEFDGSVELPLTINPLSAEGPFHFVRTYGSNIEYFEFHISGSMDLVVPIDPGPVAALG